MMLSTAGTRYRVLFRIALGDEIGPMIYGGGIPQHQRRIFCPLLSNIRGFVALKTKLSF